MDVWKWVDGLMLAWVLTDWGGCGWVGVGGLAILGGDFFVSAGVAACGHITLRKSSFFSPLVL